VREKGDSEVAGQQFTETGYAIKRARVENEAPDAGKTKSVGYPEGQFSLGQKEEGTVKKHWCELLGSAKDFGLKGKQGGCKRLGGAKKERISLPVGIR